MNFSISPENLVSFCDLMGCSVEYGRIILDEMDPALCQRMFFALQTQELDEGVMLVDPIEQDPVFGELIKKAQIKAESEIAYDGRGVCHLIWSRQAEILRNEHGIGWYSPAEMNPWIRFD
jgi:hypothetical protein